MPRPSYPPHDFTCPYEHNCPHLDWMSTKWVLGEYRRAEETYQEHLRIIETIDADLNAALKRIQSLEKENAELKAKNTALHRRQFKANRKKDTDEDGRDAEDIQIHTDGGKKKRGAPVGHPGWFREKPAYADRTIEVSAPSICPHCQCQNLRPLEGVSEHLHECPTAQPLCYPISAS